MPSRGITVGIFPSLDFHASGLFDPTSCNAAMCSTTSSSNNQWQRDHVQGEETVQRRIGGIEITHDPLHQCITDERYGTEQ